MSVIAEESSNRRPSIVMTLLLIVGAAGFMAIFFGLYHLLGVSMPYFGLLFLIYWAAILQQDLKAFFPSVLGGLTGIALGWILVAMPSLAGQPGLILSFLALFSTLFCFMRGHASLIINNATMLFLTVATIAELHIAQNVVTMAESLLIGAGYMGGVTVAVHNFAKWRSRRGLTPDLA